MGATKKQKLSPKDFEKLLSQMRMWAKHQRDTIAPLVFHVEWQKDHIQKLEEELRTLKQAHFFQKSEAIKNTPLTDPPRKEPREHWPLARRLAFLVNTGKVGSPEWERALRWSSIKKEEDALNLAASWGDHEKDTSGDVS